MNSLLTTLDPVTFSTNTKTILATDGFHCSVINLSPGDETPVHEAHDAEEHLLFVIDGEATVRFDDVNTMLKKDEAFLIPKRKAHLVAAGASGWAKLLRVDVPPRQLVVPQILTVDR
jgi:mannose-6-phosphate isomerase-like protein (cupin superfamily)